MPPTKEQHLAQLAADFAAAWDKADDADGWVDLGYAKWSIGQDHNSLNYLFGAVAWIVDALFLIIHKNYPDWGWYSIPRFLEEYVVEPEPVELTWKTICEAWAKDDFEGRFHTIAFIDRMRQIIWDEPFNVIWAAKPEGE